MVNRSYIGLDKRERECLCKFVLLFQRMLTNSYWDPKFVSRAPALKRQGQEQTRAGMREERKPAKKTMERSLPRKWFYKML